MNIFLLGLMIFLTSIIKFAINFKFFLSSLICLEFLVLLLFFMQNLLMNLILFEKLFLMIFLTFSVCEGVLGISLLVMMIRYYGNNFFQSLSCMLC